MPKDFKYNRYKLEEELALQAFEKSHKYISNIEGYTGTTYGCHYDVRAINTKKRISHIELKLRKEGARSYETCFIELKKWMHLMKDYREIENHPIPIYINFIGSYKDVYVFFLHNLKSKDMKFHPNVTIDGEVQDRIGLKWEAAWHFVYDEETKKHKLIKKGR